MKANLFPSNQESNTERNTESGISLVESLIALLLLALSVLGGMSLLLNSQAWMIKAQWHSHATNIISSLSESFNNTSYTSKELATKMLDLSPWKTILNEYFPGADLNIQCQDKGCLLSILPPKQATNLKAHHHLIMS